MGTCWFNEFGEVDITTGNTHLGIEMYGICDYKFWIPYDIIKEILSLFKSSGKVNKKFLKVDGETRHDLVVRTDKLKIKGKTIKYLEFEYRDHEGYMIKVTECDLNVIDKLI